MKTSNHDAAQGTLISLDDIPQEHREEAIEWLKKMHVEFEALSKATGWPIEKIYKIYNVFGVHLGMGLGEKGKEE